MALLHHLTMAEIFTRICAALLFAALAGGLTALFLTLFRDPSARYEGRLSASPFAHVTVSGIFLAIAFQTSWLRALPFAGQKRSFVPVAAVLCAMLTCLSLVPLLDLIRAPLHAALPRSAGYFALATLGNLQITLVSSVVLGLLPLPGMWLGAMLPALWPGLARRWRKGAGWGLSLAAILLILGWFPSTEPLMAMLKLV